MLLLAVPTEVVQKLMYNPMMTLDGFAKKKEIFDAAKQLPLNYADRVKPSMYNYIEKGKGLHAICNTLYCSMALLNDEELAVLEKRQQGEEKLLREFYAAGFFVPEDVDEFSKLQAYKKVYRKFVVNESGLGLTIATTTKCNARCAYCFESSADRADMAPGVEEQIIEFVDNHIGENKELDITWFGGEPLLNTGLIDRLSSYFLAKEYKLNTRIVTNGSLLTEKMLKESFPKWHIRNMQVTLDGTAENYARIKNYLAPELGNLDRVLKNIDLAGENKIKVSIRLNVNKENIEDLLILAEQLEKRYRGSKYVSWYASPLVGTEADYVTDEELIGMMERFAKLHPGQLKDWKMRSLPRVEYCMAEMPSGYCFDVNGDIKICWEDFTFSGNAIGNIKDFDPKTDKRNEQSQLQPKCEKCVWLPQCGGGCIARRSKGNYACQFGRLKIISQLRKMIK